MERRALTEAERLDWLQLIRSDGVGPVTFQGLLAKYGTASRALAELPDLARGKSVRAVRLADRASAERELSALYKYGARLIAACEPDYPAPLAAIADAPPLLAVHGRAELLHAPCLGIVGARNASANGRRFAARIAAELGAAGLVVVSGLARGIDTAAHEGALATGTVAAIAGGVDVAYPPENGELMRRICTEGGCVVAEQPFGLKPTARHFPYRNRIISGLSRALLVVEATLKSGSLITARLAAEQGREVLAVPGSPLDARAAGTNGLIRDGAALVASAADALAAIGPIDEPFQALAMGTRFKTSALLHVQPEDEKQAPETVREPFGGESEAQHKILELLGYSAIAIDDLTRRSHLSPAALSAALFELELAGRVERQPGGLISLVVSKT